jgi:hypothetical protein
MPTRPTSTLPPATAPVPAPDPALRRPAALVTAGALGVAGTTALEVLTSPYSPAVRFYPLNGAVHVGKVAAVLVLTAGLLLLASRLRPRLGRMGTGAMATVGVAALGAVPYSLAEATLDGGLSPAAANDRLEATYADHFWIAGAGMVALPVILLGIVTLAVVVLRRRALPAWAPITSLLAIPAAVLAGVAGDAGIPAPHPPTWLFLGLSTYGFVLLRRTARSEPVRR